MTDDWKAPEAEKKEDTAYLDSPSSWKLLEKTLLAGIQEQKRARRWGIFFKLLTFTYLIGALLLFSSGMDLEQTHRDSASHTALIEVKGVIADQEEAGADKIITALRAAFENSGTKGVILRINSPGGSPVQSGYVYDEIRRLRAKYPKIKLYAVISDLGASGAYYIASAADEIYADKASLVGSIGVTAATFGFVDTMKTLGVERRVYTAGEHKAFLDPFQKEKPEETAFWKTVLDTTHKQFIDQVKQGRGDRLKANEHPELFSGLVWSGEQALALGLIDGLGSAGFVARERIGEENIQDFTLKQTPLDRFAKRLGTDIADHLALLFGFQGISLR